MKITRLYTGDDNESRIEDIDIPLEDKGAPVCFVTLDENAAADSIQ